MLPARTVLLLTLLLTFSLHHATGKEPQGPLLQVRALNPHWGHPIGDVRQQTPAGSGNGATLWSGQGSTSWDQGMDGDGAEWSQQSQTSGEAAGAWRRLWQLFPRSQLGKQRVKNRENMQLFGAFQNTLQVVPLPWKAPKPPPQTEHPDLTVCFGGCSNLGCEGPGPRLSPAPPLPTSQSCACCVKGDNPLSQGAMGAAEKLEPPWCAPNPVVLLSGDAILNIPLPSTAHFAPVECCFQYAQKRIRQPQSFYVTSKDCPKPAVVIVAANGDEICADPKKDWVNKIIKRLEKKNINPSTI
ncbi:C-C motif chemokine 22 [Sylvia borin]